MSENEDKLKSLEILVNATRSKVDYQLNADNALDTKAGVMVVLEIGIVTFYIQNIDVLLSFSVIPIIFFTFSIFLLWKVLNIKTYSTGVVDFYNDPKDYCSMKFKTLLEQVLSDYQEAFDMNAKNLEAKNTDYKISLKLFIIGFILLIFFI